MLFHWFFKVLEGGGARQTKKKNNSFGDGLREPKPSFSFVFSMFPKPGGPWGIKKHCFFIGFSRFGRGGARQMKKKNSFGDGLREPKPSFSFVFSMFPWPGGAWAPGGAQGAREAWSPLGEPGSGELGEGSGRVQAQVLVQVLVQV